MSKRGLSIAVVVLTGVCTALMYQLWSDRERMAAQTSAAASRGVPHGAQTPVDNSPLAVQSSQGADSTSAGSTTAAAIPSAQEQETHALVKGLGGLVNSYRQRLNDLPVWLSIPDSQKDALARLWVNQILEMPEEAEQTPDGERWRENQREAGRQIEQLLGPDLHARWREYEETSLARSRLSALNSKLGAEALSDDTVRSIASVMTQAARQAEAERQAKYGDEVRDPATPKSLDILQETNRRSNKLMREAARPYLSSEQMKVFDQMQKRQQTLYELDVAHAKGRMAAETAETKADSGTD